MAVAYGSDGTSIAAHIGMPVEKAKAMVTNLIAGMPGMSKFQKEASKFVRKHGYVMINTITGHRVYWPEWASWKAFDDTLDENFWQEYNSCHKGTGDYIDKQMKNYRKAKHTWFGKNVLNYPIQGGSAVVLKQAIADLFEWIVKNNYFGIILFCVAVHDEVDCECPKELADKFSKVLQDIMQKAAYKYYKKLPIPAECSVGDHWIH